MESKPSILLNDLYDNVKIKYITSITLEKTKGKWNYTVVSFLHYT